MTEKLVSFCGALTERSDSLFFVWGGSKSSPKHYAGFWHQHLNDCARGGFNLWFDGGLRSNAEV